MNTINTQPLLNKIKTNYPIAVWFLLAAAAAIAEISRGPDSYNNYLIYKNVFTHAQQLQNLYVGEPAHLFDYLYGPIFSIIIAPFSVLPDTIGCFVWCMFNAWILFYAVNQLPISYKKKMLILLLSAIELETSIHNVQINPMIVSWIVLSYVLVQKEKDFWATLFIALGFMVKLYGIVGIAFFLFSKHKIKFVLSFIFWLIVLFCLPMLISSPSFIIQSYKDWFIALTTKNEKNIAVNLNYMQDISVMGMIRRIFKLPNMSNAFVLIPAAIAYALPFLRIKQFKYLSFQLSYLAFALIGVVIFSSSSESPSYIIALIGVSIWFILQTNQQKKMTITLIIFTLLLTSLSPTDLFPEYVRINFIRPYSLKALPCFVVWLYLLIQLLQYNWKKQDETVNGINK